MESPPVNNVIDDNIITTLVSKHNQNVENLNSKLIKLRNDVLDRLCQIEKELDTRMSGSPRGCCCWSSRRGWVYFLLLAGAAHEGRCLLRLLAFPGSNARVYGDIKNK